MVHTLCSVLLLMLGLFFTAFIRNLAVGVIMQKYEGVFILYQLAGIPFGSLERKNQGGYCYDTCGKASLSGPGE